MEHIAPLIQTLLWVVLIGGVMIRFHRPIYDILVSLQKRIDAGSSVRAGPFELGSDVRPSNADEQREKLAAELEQVLSEQADGPSEQPPVVQAQVQSRLIQAEDLALRAVQSEFGKPINRQMTLGLDVRMDGAFVLNDRLHVVEVKYLLKPKSGLSSVRTTLERYTNAFGRYRRSNVTIVLVLVFQNEIDVDVYTHQARTLSRGFSLDVDVRGYALPELQRRFGIQQAAGG